MNDLSIEYFYKKFEFRAGRINLISDFFFVWVGLPLRRGNLRFFDN